MVIRNKDGIINLVSLINGKFRTPKIEKLNKLINWINVNYLTPKKEKLNSNYIIPILPLDSSNILNNSWLSGFSEGDATFQIRVTKPSVNRTSPYYHIATYYELTQSRLNNELFNEYKSIMESISNVFICKLSLIKLSKFDRTGKQNAWRVKTSSKKGAIEVVKYFSNFPLFSSKHLDFLCWKEAQILIETKQHHSKKTTGYTKNEVLNPEEGSIYNSKTPTLLRSSSNEQSNEITINKLLELKLKMNSKRTIFNWDHLKNFYSN